MRTLKLVFATLLASSAPGAAIAHDASTAVASPRATYNLNPGWKSATGDLQGAEQENFDDSAWTAVTLPNAFNEKQAFARDIKKLSTGITWYRKHITVPLQKGGRAFLEFEGVRQAAEVWVNGKSVALSENGVTAFGADITAALKPGENLIAVRVDNDWKYKERAGGSNFQWNNDNFNVNYGGITKNVRLHLTGPVYQTLPLFQGLGTTGQYVWADGFDLPKRAATIHAETQVRNQDSAPRRIGYRVEVRDRAGKIVARFDGGIATVAPGETRTLAAQGRVAGLNFWAWGYGYLYNVTTSLIENGKVIDSVDTLTGFRQTKFADGMITLNGKVIQMHGYAQRTSNEWPAVGVSIPPWLSDFSNGLMVESGGNLVRWMHISPSKQDVESADRVGLIQAMPAGDAESDVTGRRWEQRKEVMRDGIIYNRNNPSILFFEGGNENISDPHMAELKAIRDQYDPNGGRAIGSREMLDSKVAEYGGEMLYINKSAKHPMWAMEYSRDEGARAYRDDFTPPFHKDSPDYNRNQDSHAIEDVRRWWDYYRARPGTGKRVSSGGVNIIWADSNTHYRGDNNYRRSGEVDAMRIPKDGFFAHRVMWSDWVDSRTPGTYIIGHWNYAPGTAKDINVVSNGESVELFLNGKSLGKGERSLGFLFTWKGVSWAPGALKAVATHKDGRRSEFAVQTTGAPVALRLKPHTSPRGFVMDGADMALVDVEVVDAHGRRVPTATDMVGFKLEGPAEWRGGIAQGDSSGKPRAEIAVGDPTKPAGPDQTTQYAGTAREEDNYVLSPNLPVEGGVNRVLLRAGAGKGAVRVTATAAGLKSATLSIPTVQPVAAKGGLSRDFPEAHQPGLLTRGPTPMAPTFAATRTALAAVSIIAGSNQADAANTTDDNELSRWSNDGKQETAWIEYRFAGPVTLSEIDLKLVGWRTRPYPLRVTLDGKTVWEGETERSLGYVTLAFTPAKGQVLRIEMTGTTADRDAFGKIVELDTARKAGDTGADAVPAGWRLGIVEAEFYSPVAGGTKALVLAATPAPDPEVYILAGQSNMSGRGSLADLSEAERAPDPAIRVYGNDGKLRVATEPLDDATGQIDAVSADKLAAVGPGMAFARELRRLRKREIILVPCAKGGTAIRSWKPAEARDTLYGSCLARAREAGYKVTGILWYQGETDAELPERAVTWRADFESIVAAWRRDLGMPRLPLVLVQLADQPPPEGTRSYPDWGVVQQAQASVHLRCTSMVSAKGMPRNADNLHLSTPAQRDLGTALARAMDQLRHDRCR